MLFHDEMSDRLFDMHDLMYGRPWLISMIYIYIYIWLGMFDALLIVRCILMCV